MRAVRCMSSWKVPRWMRRPLGEPTGRMARYRRLLQLADGWLQHSQLGGELCHMPFKLLQVKPRELHH